MSERKFAHLHCHTHYSLLDGVSRVPELVAQVKSLGMTACAITDHGNLFGAVEFYSECRKAGINPVVGMEAYVAPGSRLVKKAKNRGDAGHHLTLLAKNRIGWHNLIKMASIASLEGYYYVPRIDHEVLRAHSEGIVCLSGCVSSEFSRLILADKDEDARALLMRLEKVFGENLYVEIQDNGLQIQAVCRKGAVDAANRCGLPLVATSDAHYLKQEDGTAQEVLLCINMGNKLSDPNRMRSGDDGSDKASDQFYVCGPDDMYNRMPLYGDAIRKSQEIADGCDIQLDLKARHYPVFTPPPGRRPEEYLRELCEAGLTERYGSEPPPEARARLEHELGIICKMQFASYFLIVWDFVRFARDNGIPCGARGSGVGAIVSYVLYLSHVCPLKYGLLFERFLDPNRAEAPDIDIDFCQDRREEVIAYVRRKYGDDAVAQIATFGTMAARAAIRDVARVLDVPLADADRLAKLVPEKPGTTLDDALAQSSELSDEYNGNLKTRAWIDLARKLEGTNRNAGTHAAGIVISHGPLVNHVPLQRVTRKGDKADAGAGGVTTQWVMGDLEKVGLLKMDFLGLKNLTILDRAVQIIGEVRGEWVDIDDLPEGDRDTYAMLQKGDTAGVFQFESSGIREMLKRMRPDCLDDLIAANALYRPGPLDGGLVDSFINRKHGQEPVPKVHPVYDSVLEKTYGVIVFQEDVMRILNRLGGIELAKAYACIKAISKKKHDVINANEKAFVEGAKAQGMSEEKALEIFGQICLFAGYGFNKSHSSAYANIAYQTAFLKAHYRPEYTAAMLTSDVSDRDSLVAHIDDSRRAGVNVLPPDVNVSDVIFTTDAAGRVVFGLAAVKGLGEGAAREVVRARREGGSFCGLTDFFEKVDVQKCGKSHTEKLIDAGAFDGLLPPGGHRAQLVAMLPRLADGASRTQKDRRRGRRSLFETLEADPDSMTVSDDLPAAEPWTTAELLRREKETLDMYLSSHPLAAWASEIAAFSTHSVGELAGAAGRKVVVGGLISGVRLMNTKNSRPGAPTRYARFKLEDMASVVECVMWPDAYEKFGPGLVDDAVVYATATGQENRDKVELVVARLTPVEGGAAALARGLAVRVFTGGTHPSLLDRLAVALAKFRGPPRAQRVPVFLVVSDPAGRMAELKADDEWAVCPTAVSVPDLEELVGVGNVRFMGSNRASRSLPGPADGARPGGG